MRLTYVLVACFTVVACGAEPVRQRVAEQDSAGVLIVESSSPRWSGSEGWSVHPDPELDLAKSGNTTPHNFFGVADATRLSDGVIAVADAQSGEIRFFAPTGQFVGAVGRKGEGPGEFARLDAVGRFRGDSIIAFDGASGRVTVLGPQWHVGRIISLELPFVSDLHVMHDSTFIAQVFSPSDLSPAAGEGLYRRPRQLVRFSTTGYVTDTVAAIPGPEEYRVVRSASQWLSVRPLFGKEPQIVTYNGRIYSGSADRLEFETFSATGHLEGIVRAVGLDLRLTAKEVEQERVAMLGPNPSPMKREVFSALPDPEFRPAYSELLVDAHGFVWAEEAQGWAKRDQPRNWNVFSPDGEWLGAVQVPGRFTVFEIGTDYVLGRRRDQLEVEHVELLRLNRGQ